jgi:hypothetical protein
MNLCRCKCHTVSPPSTTIQEKNIIPESKEIIKIKCNDWDIPKE